MKKPDLYLPFAFAFMIASCLCTGCSGNLDVAGTAEEPNECANNDSSSSTPASSSSLEPVPYSSSEKNTESQANKPITLESYIAQFGIDSLQFDDAVLAGKAEASQTPPPEASDPSKQSASATEFDGPWPHPFVKQNIDALNHYFPEAVNEFAGLIDSIKDGTADENCKLYMLNVFGDSKTIGFVLADVAKDTISVIDIVSGNCKETADAKLYRYLFRYCGELSSRPEIEHRTVEIDITPNMCPTQDTGYEWLRSQQF